MAEQGLFGDLDDGRGARRAPKGPVPERPRRAPRERGPAPGAASLWADVAVNRPMRCEFTYAVPDALASAVAAGARVAVPFGAQRVVGVVTALRTEPPDMDPRRVRWLSRVLDDEPVVGQELFELTRWIAGRWACSWGEALAAVLPGSLKHETGRRRVAMARAADGVGEAELAELEEKHPKQHRLLRTLLEVGGPIELAGLLSKLNLSTSPARSLESRGFMTVERVAAVDDPLARSTTRRARPETLTPDQQHAVEEVARRVEAGEHATFLLQGITGSGKTEVYLRVIERALAVGKGAVVLVPEIALTPQTVGWFRSRFGEVAVLHSRMTDAQRRETWLKVRHGGVRVVVGARSAVFAPVRDLGVIVVDEEHEPSFKQGETPRYHARDVAVERARRLGAVCILGSATPSLESWHAAREGGYEHLRLSARATGGKLPRIEIVDMAHERGKDGSALFSRRLRQALDRAFERGEQALLFRNRRGFAPVLWCLACNTTAKCASCDVSLTFHRRIRRAVCHVCCEELPPPKTCPTCSAPAMRYLGMGSERVEAELAALYPTARIRRMDSDTMQRREDYDEVLEAFGRGDLDVLVGTQMIAKGLDFPRVTVVGIVSADSSLYIPDFRAAERTFQLLVQVAGRAGRGDVEGEIVVQTQTPSHPAILRAAAHDYEGFAAEEDALRRELGYPPHGRLVRVVLDDTDPERVEKAAAALAERLRPLVAEFGFDVLGPAPAPIAMLRGRHRTHLLIKAGVAAPGFGPTRELLASFAEEHARPRITIDVDPMSMM